MAGSTEIRIQALCEEQEELLENHGASTETLRCFRSLAERALRPAKVGGGFQLGLRERGAALQSLCFHIHAVGMDPKSIFQAATLLDAFLGKSSAEIGVGVVPAATLAVVRILKKTGKANGVKRFPAEFANYPVCLLRSLGYQIHDCFEEDVRDAELAILAALDWQVNLQPVLFWLEKFTMRFSALAWRGMQEERMREEMQSNVLQLGGIIATKLLWLKEASALLPPHAAAAGALGLGLVRLGALPASSLRPRNVSPEMWSDAVDVLSGGSQGGFDTVLPGCAEQKLSAFVLPAVDSSLGQLQQACWEVVSALASASRQPYTA